MVKVKLDTALIWVALLLLVFACITPSIRSTPIPTPASFSQDDLSTIVAQTASAAQIQTASALPTVTPTLTATRIPTNTPTSTPTFIYLLRTDTPIPSETPTSGPVANIVVNGTLTVDKRLTDKPWSCLVTGSSPPRNISQKPGKEFTITWTVMNTGTKAWSNNGIDFVYHAGYGTNQRPIQDLWRSVPSGGSIDVKIVLVAPKPETISSYNVIWALKVGSKKFCYMRYVFTVE